MQHIETNVSLRPRVFGFRRRSVSAQTECREPQASTECREYQEPGAPAVTKESVVTRGDLGRKERAVHRGDMEQKERAVHRGDLGRKEQRGTRLLLGRFPPPTGNSAPGEK